jgi:redox-sensitive bicupin YhaK (pirin superfamily)
MVEPHFTMLWNERIPRLAHRDEAGRLTTVTVVAGALPGAAEPLAPPPESWAAQPDADVAIWTLHLAPGARWVLPAARGQGTRRMLYFFAGDGLRSGRSTSASTPRWSWWRARTGRWTNTGTRPWNACCCKAAPSASPWRSTARS